jgi:hypothetical protein
MLNVISLVIEQRKKEFDRIAKVRFFSSIFMPCEGDITFRTPVGIYFSLKNQIRNIYAKKKISQRGDIARTQNLLISFKPIICKLNYSHVIIYNY